MTIEAFKPIWALGLMSGTSIDGIDVALIETDGEQVFDIGPASTIPYSAGLERSIRGSLGQRVVDATLINDITHAHAIATKTLLSRHPEYKEKLTVVGLHGHTVLHAPGEGITVQVGNGLKLAKLIGYDVVYDFRTEDVTAGGQGAPLAPLYHEALSQGLRGPVSVVNIGGISNITWIDRSGGAPPVAFDTGPGNALLDDWIKSKTELPYDLNGLVSSAGKPDTAIVLELMSDPYFSAPPPKSLDRMSFNYSLIDGLSAEDGAATLVRFTCESLTKSLSLIPSLPAQLLVTGGGRHNPTMIETLAKLSEIPVNPVETVGWDGDAIEAQAFAFLAVRSLRSLPISLPSTTGVSTPTTGGKIASAS